MTPRDVLFLAHRIPYPPNKGDKTRAWHFLGHLARTRRVYVGCFVDDASDWAHVPVLKEVAAEACCVPLSPARALARGLTALPTRQPLTLPYYRDARLSAWVRGLRSLRNPTVFAYSACMAQYVMDWRDSPRIIDFVDVDSAKWQDYAGHRQWPISALYRRESAALLRAERAIAGEFDRSIFVSEPEADLFRRLAPETADRIVAITNGIDAEQFSPQGPYADPYDGAGGSAICFTGMMDYWPNVDAVAWFVDAVFPRIRAIRPEARFWIVGARPAPGVRKLAERDGVIVTGRVPDTRPYLAHASAVVAPLRVARGIQNKILEGMAMARPVIASPEAFEGISAVPGRDVLVASGVDEFVSAIERVWTRSVGVAIGAAARAVIENEYAWSRNYQALDAVLGSIEQRRPITSISP